MASMTPPVSAESNNQPRKAKPAGFWLVICLCIGGCVCPLVVGSFLFPVFAQAKEVARATVCKRNLQTVGNAIMAFQKSQGEFPEDLNVVIPMADTHGMKADLVKCPKIVNPGFGRGYAYNGVFYGMKKLSRISQDDLHKYPLLIEIEDPNNDEVTVDCTFPSRHLLGKWVNAYFVGVRAVRIQLSEEQLNKPVVAEEQNLFSLRKMPSSGD